MLLDTRPIEANALDISAMPPPPSWSLIRICTLLSYTGWRVVASPAYSLQQGDIIYVEPNGVKKRTTTVNGNTALSASFWVSVASLLTSVAVLIFK